MEFLALLALAVVVILVIHFRAQGRIKALESQVEERASSRYDEWRRRDVDRINAEQREVARREAQARMQEWQVTHEANIRADAINRSQAVITGKVSENVAPFMPLFPYNPKDVRFVGNPIDLIVFDGASEGCLRDVIFLEVKTGRSSLASVQKQIRAAVSEGRVKWLEFRVPTR
jgi:predicted Holliday junction resolvase-like endonuclease